MSWLDTLETIRNRDWSEASSDERKNQANEVVTLCGYAGALTAAMPVPLADLALLLPVNSAMVMTVAHVYGRSLTETEAKRLVAELGTVAGLSFAGHAAIGVLKRLLLPGVGGLLSIPATFALTWAIGQVAIAYFDDPNLSREDLKTLFKEAVREGSSSFSKEAFDRFRSKEEPVDAENTPAAPEVDERLKQKKRSL